MIAYLSDDLQMQNVVVNTTTPHSKLLFDFMRDLYSDFLMTSKELNRKRDALADQLTGIVVGIQHAVSEYLKFFSDVDVDNMLHTKSVPVFAGTGRSMFGITVIRKYHCSDCKIHKVERTFQAVMDVKITEDNSGTGSHIETLSVMNSITCPKCNQLRESGSVTMSCGHILVASFYHYASHMSSPQKAPVFKLNITSIEIGGEVYVPFAVTRTSGGHTVVVYMKCSGDMYKYNDLRDEGCPQILDQPELPTTIASGVEYYVFYRKVAKQ